MRRSRGIFKTWPRYTWQMFQKYLKSEFMIAIWNYNGALESCEQACAGRLFIRIISR